MSVPPFPSLPSPQPPLPTQHMPISSRRFTFDFPASGARLTYLSQGNVLAGGAGKTLTFWNTKTGNVLDVIGFAGTVRCLGGVPSDHTVYCGLSDGTLSDFTVEAGRVRKFQMISG